MVARQQMHGAPGRRTCGRKVGGRCLWVAAFGVFCGAGAVLAQEGAPVAPAQPVPPADAAPAAAAATPGAAASLVVTLDQERFFQTTLYGRAVLQGVEREAAALGAENRRIEAALEAEERALTVRRASLSPEDFAPLAAAFDDKVETIRAEQDAKSRGLNQRLDAERKQFFDAAVPVLTDLLAERGAAAILANDAVLLSLNALDITELAIARMDARLPAPPAAADPAPEQRQTPPDPASP